MKTYYVYNEKGENIACVYAFDTYQAYKEAVLVTGLQIDSLSVEIA